MNGWIPGARAVIVASEHFVNMNRVVSLTYNFKFVNGATGWKVEDGGMFFGYQPNNAINPDGTRNYVQEKVLGIEQWKLRLLGPEEETKKNEQGIEYVLAD